jgi:diadenosine tetraphosphate (Ap4A) HIT family hydrolase
VARHQDNCEICARLERLRSGADSGLIAEMETGFAVMGEWQVWRGYAILLCKEPATELDELPPDFRAAFLRDMVTLASAIRRVVNPHKLNYECLGNQVHHLHWHIFPRYLDEPAPLQPVWDSMPLPPDTDRFDPVRHGDLRDAIAAELADGRRSAVGG